MRILLRLAILALLVPGAAALDVGRCSPACVAEELGDCQASTRPPLPGAEWGVLLP